MSKPLLFHDPSDLRDLAAFLTRAKKLDADGAVKLRSFGDVLAVYVAPIYSGSLLADGPTVLGLRTIKLADQAQIDGTFEISSILERIEGPGSNALELAIPPSNVRVVWSGVLPPRENWELISTLNQIEITSWAKAGIEEVATSLPESIGASIANKVRLQVWGRVVGEHGMPAGAAFAMSGLGFMEQGEVISVYSSSNWLRLTSKHGHVITKRATGL